MNGARSPQSHSWSTGSDSTPSARESGDGVRPLVDAARRRLLLSEHGRGLWSVARDEIRSAAAVEDLTLGLVNAAFSRGS